MTDLAAAIGDLLAAEPITASRSGARCRWCGQEWTASRTSNCRHFSTGAGHCPDCGRQWTAGREAHCAACHRHFSSDSVADAHFRLDHDPCQDHPKSRCYARSVCLDPAILTKRDGSLRFVQVATTDGPMWSGPPMSAEAIAQRKGTP
jgi:hypothetical protein